LLYGDKVNSDIILTPKLEISFSFTDLTNSGVDIPFIGYFSVNGSAVVSGRVVLDAYESVTQEKLWTKPINLEPINVSWEGEVRDKDTTLSERRNQWSSFALNDPGFQRVLIPELNTMFERVMRTAWDYLDPREFATLKRQADQLKSKAQTTVR
jgi:hypothetical protein